MARIISIILAVMILLTGCTPASDMAKVLPLPRNVNMGFDFTYYPNEAAFKAELDRLKTSKPGVFNYHTDRKDYGGQYNLYWITIGDTSKPAIFMISTLHAKNEKGGAHLLMKFAEKLLDPNDNQKEFNKKLLNKYSVILIPIANPYGYFSSRDGKHYNNHPMTVPDIETATWHDMTKYKGCVKEYCCF